MRLIDRLAIAVTVAAITGAAWLTWDQAHWVVWITGSAVGVLADSCGGGVLRVEMEDV